MSLGLYVVFGVVLAPLYLVLLGWFVGDPRDNKTALIGLGFLVAILLGPVVFSVFPIAFRLIIPT